MHGRVPSDEQATFGLKSEMFSCSQAAQLNTRISRGLLRPGAKVCNRYIDLRGGFAGGLELRRKPASVMLKESSGWGEGSGSNWTPIFVIMISTLSTEKDSDGSTDTTCPRSQEQSEPGFRTPCFCIIASCTSVTRSRNLTVNINIHAWY